MGAVSNLKLVDVEDSVPLLSERAHLILSQPVFFIQLVGIVIIRPLAVVNLLVAVVAFFIAFAENRGRHLCLRVKLVDQEAPFFER